MCKQRHAVLVRYNIFLDCLACALSQSLVFFFNDTATTEIYTLSLHDALPISVLGGGARHGSEVEVVGETVLDRHEHGDRKSTRLNSSHQIISYAVFCLKKKKHSLHHSSIP